jgi:hypothetical protein
MTVVEFGARVDWEILWNNGVVLQKSVLQKTWWEH